MTLSQYIDQLLALGYRDIRFIPCNDDYLTAQGATHDVFLTVRRPFSECDWLRGCFYYTSINITTCNEYDLPF